MPENRGDGDHRDGGARLGSIGAPGPRHRGAAPLRRLIRLAAAVSNAAFLPLTADRDSVRPMPSTATVVLHRAVGFCSLYDIHPFSSSGNV